MAIGSRTRGVNRNVSRVQDANFERMPRWQQRVLAEWMGCFSACEDTKTKEAYAQVLKEKCLANEVRAQTGYEIIVLKQEPKGTDGSVPEAMEKRMYATLTNVISQHSDSIGERAFDAVTKCVDAMKKQLEAFAKEQVRDAAERRAPITIKNGTKTKQVKGVLPPEFEQMVQLASARIPILLVGPAGCGKTFLCAKLAEAIDLEYGDESCSEGMSEAIFKGQLLPTGKQGAFEHHASEWMERYEKGGVFLLDEIDASDPNLLTYMNKAVANDFYTVNQRFKKRRVTKHEDFVLVAAANTFGNGADAMYVGRNQLDAATLDRFKVGLITLDYNRDVEASIAPVELCEWAWSVRDKIYSNKLRRIMSTRVIKDLAKMTERYSWSKPEWTAAYFKGWTAAEKNLCAAM